MHVSKPNLDCSKGFLTLQSEVYALRMQPRYCAHIYIRNACVGFRGAIPCHVTRMSNWCLSERQSSRFTKGSRRAYNSHLQRSAIRSY
jgi:hypothetical protein